MVREPPVSTRTYTLFPYPTLFLTLDHAHVHLLQFIRKRAAEAAMQIGEDRDRGPRRFAPHDGASCGEFGKVDLLRGRRRRRRAARARGIGELGNWHFFFLDARFRSEEHQSDIQSLMRTSYS